MVFLALFPLKIVCASKLASAQRLHLNVYFGVMGRWGSGWDRLKDLTNVSLSIYMSDFLSFFIKGSVEAQCGLVLNGQGGVIRRGKEQHIKTKHSSLICYFAFKVQ